MSNRAIAKAQNNKMSNATIDIVKLIMAILVVGIHTEPFGFNIWLDRGFGIITRFCVPFFFVSSSFFYWKSNKKPLAYIARLFLLYAIWVIIYLPFDREFFTNKSLLNIIIVFFWSGYRHLWYVICSIIGFIMVLLLSKTLREYKTPGILIVSMIFLMGACFYTTWSPLLYRAFGIDLSENNEYTCRNGLFYAFPYMALGQYIAQKHKENSIPKMNRLCIGFICSLILLVGESFVFVVWLNTKFTILWFSVLPLSYFLFTILLNVRIALPKETSLTLRKASTLTYFIHPLLITVFSPYFRFISLFIIVTVVAVLISLAIIYLSKIKFVKWMQYLY